MESVLRKPVLVFSWFFSLGDPFLLCTFDRGLQIEASVIGRSVNIFCSFFHSLHPRLYTALSSPVSAQTTRAVPSVPSRFFRSVTVISLVGPTGSHSPASPPSSVSQSRAYFSLNCHLEFRSPSPTFKGNDQTNGWRQPGVLSFRRARTVLHPHARVSADQKFRARAFCDALSKVVATNVGLALPQPATPFVGGRKAAAGGSRSHIPRSVTGAVDLGG